MEEKEFRKEVDNLEKYAKEKGIDKVAFSACTVYAWAHKTGKGKFIKQFASDGHYPFVIYAYDEDSEIEAQSSQLFGTRLSLPDDFSGERPTVVVYKHGEISTIEWNVKKENG